MNIVSDTEKQDAVKDWNPNYLVIAGAPCSERLPGALHLGQSLWAGRQGNNALLYEFADFEKRTGIHDYIVLNKMKNLPHQDEVKNVKTVWNIFFYPFFMFVISEFIILMQKKG